MFAALVIERMNNEESAPILDHDHGQRSDEAEEARSSCGCFGGEDGIARNVRMGFRHVSEALSRPRVKGIFTRILRWCKRGEKTKRNTGFTYDPRSYALNFDHGSDEESARL
ncbi:hypothetical protein MLD38_014584 [Melastoma candidum]|uniref:Uncharacterized protein n=1 Tax=Melastoma candidum TaxID=119954 RepID=A0ACB9RCL1_9MYRT|nr:hypothetical protein MLD38_014584 [Melastoma candidum]